MNQKGIKSPKSPIYLDYASTTPVDERVAQKMMDYLTLTGVGAGTGTGGFGNPSSKHSFGQTAKNAVEAARSQVANLLNTKPECLYFTSGATESNNMAIKGVAEFYQRFGKHIITSQIEHKSVLEVFSYLMQKGFEVTFIKPNAEGIISAAAVKEAIRPDTILVSIMHVNNETGVIQEIESMAEYTRKQEIIFHVDAAQSAGKIKIDLAHLPVDLLSLSAHKLYGPKGIGALYVCDNPKARLLPLLHGSGQERNLRSGTLATHQIVGMGEAYRIMHQEMASETKHLQALNDKFMAGIKDLPGLHLNGHPSQKVPNVLNLCFENIELEKLNDHMKSLAISSSSACTAATMETSHVLRAMGFHNEWALRSLRFSMGRFTTIAEIDETIKIIRNIYDK